MRHIIKPLLAALLALLALAALTSTASAEICRKGASEAEHKTLCVEGKQVGSAGTKVTTTAGFKLKTGTTAVLDVPPQGWSVVCAGVKTSEIPVIKSGGSGEVRLEDLALLFRECTVQGIQETTCTAALSTYSLSGSLALPESVTLVGASEPFGELNIDGCALSGEIPIKGYQGCSLKQAEVEAIAKEFVCEPKNSHLRFGEGYGGPPTLKLEGNLELAGTSKGKKYSITK